MTLLLGSESNASLPGASLSSTTASKVGLPNTGIKCATCGWKHGCSAAGCAPGRGKKGPFYFHFSSLGAAKQFLVPSAGWGDAKRCSDMRQPAGLLRECSSYWAWLSLEQQEETVTPFPRSLTGNSGDCKCIAKCLLSHFLTKQGSGPFCLLGYKYLN